MERFPNGARVLKPTEVHCVAPASYLLRSCFYKIRARLCYIFSFSQHSLFLSLIWHESETQRDRQCYELNNRSVDPINASTCLICMCVCARARKMFLIERVIFWSRFIRVWSYNTTNSILQYKWFQTAYHCLHTPFFVFNNFPSFMRGWSFLIRATFPVFVDLREHCAMETPYVCNFDTKTVVLFAWRARVRGNVGSCPYYLPSWSCLTNT